MSEYYTRKYKRKGSKKRLWIFLGVLLAILIFIIVFFQTNVNRVLVSVSEATVQAMTTTAVNDAVFQTMENTSSYEDLVSIERNNAGDIVAITSDSLKINSLARRTASVAQKNLSELSAGGVRIPLGAFSGIEILAGTGPRVNVKIVPIGNVLCKFSSKFTSAGINQTLHSIFVDVQTSVSIILPTRTVQVGGSSQVLIAESVIVGKVPDVYLNGNIFGEGFDLVPDCEKSSKNVEFF